jgi:hypothetical protein
MGDGGCAGPRTGPWSLPGRRRLISWFVQQGGGRGESPGGASADVWRMEHVEQGGP